ncbi:hypothetical protein QYG89_15330 [Bacillus sp. B190/17]|uniref:Carboxylesterase n=1 Tax=Bacillus lumedeiriae TaxID=3058829 RepID=A0ABW8IBZ2_9BACI
MQVLQGSLDDCLYKKSAQIIYDTVTTEDKQLKWHEQSDHIITLDKKHEKVYDDVNTFLHILNWSE